MLDTRYFTFLSRLHTLDLENNGIHCSSAKYHAPKCLAVYSPVAELLGFTSLLPWLLNSAANPRHVISNNVAF